MKVHENDDLILASFILGQNWNTNAYVLADKYSRIAWLVDPGFSPGRVLDFLAGRGLSLERIILTHAHLDHIGGLTQIKETYPKASILIHAAEAGYPREPDINLMAAAGLVFPVPEPDGLLQDGQRIQSGALDGLVIHTPGHSPGSICLYLEKEGFLISGDTLFQGSVGRCDFPLSDEGQMISSLKEKILCLPEKTLVFPGHGPETILGHEKLYNPFLW
ncbi:MAG: MBL fold metallo-hydrolase [Spirochaetales bacterium]|jgi:glyoxylase-like metal-dependent hydrolase (beta-lactamase superfamily II)|nr:MBL fold metallo-hydrolase [Spirochaetales bacterium]